MQLASRHSPFTPSMTGYTLASPKVAPLSTPFPLHLAATPLLQLPLFHRFLLLSFLSPLPLPLLLSLSPPLSLLFLLLPTPSPTHSIPWIPAMQMRILLRRSFHTMEHDSIGMLICRNHEVEITASFQAGCDATSAQQTVVYRSSCLEHLPILPSMTCDQSLSVPSRSLLPRDCSLIRSDRIHLSVV